MLSVTHPASVWPGEDFCSSWTCVCQRFLNLSCLHNSASFKPLPGHLAKVHWAHTHSGARGVRGLSLEEARHLRSVCNGPQEQSQWLWGVRTHGRGAPVGRQKSGMCESYSWFPWLMFPSSKKRRILTWLSLRLSLRERVSLPRKLCISHYISINRPLS